MKFVDYAASPLFKGTVVGDSGAGKTVQAAYLANAGFNVRIADFSGGLAALGKKGVPHELTPEGAARLFYQEFHDDLTSSKAAGWANFRRMMAKGWLEGEENLGSPTDWGPDTVFIIDDGSGYTEAAQNYALTSNGKRMTDQLSMPEWGIVNREVNGYISLLFGRSCGCHVIYNTHWVLVDDDAGISRSFPKCGTKANSASNTGWRNDNIVWLRSSKKDGRVFQTQGDHSRELKFAATSDRLVEGNIVKLFELFGIGEKIDG